jgi:hypothetical protein
MSVAVMPFTPASTSADDERLAERITLDVTSGIERAQRSALVASHGLVVAKKYKGTATDPRAMGHDLNVRYLVEGEMRDENGGNRRHREVGGDEEWNAGLEQPSGGNPGERWQGRNRCQCDEPPATCLYDAEKKRIASLPREGANAMELVLHADAFWKQDPSPKGRLAARKLYEEALRHDPASVPAMDGIMGTIGDELEHDSGADRERLVKEMDDLSMRAVQADRNDPRVWMNRTYALEWQERWDAALESSAQAMRIDSYRPAALVRGLVADS